MGSPPAPCTRASVQTIRVMETLAECRRCGEPRSAALFTPGHRRRAASGLPVTCVVCIKKEITVRLGDRLRRQEDAKAWTSANGAAECRRCRAAVPLDTMGDTLLARAEKGLPITCPACASRKTTDRMAREERARALLQRSGAAACRNCGAPVALDQVCADLKARALRGRAITCLACRSAVYAPREGICELCGGWAKLTREHLIPRCRGGTLCVRACAPCNFSKGSLSLDEWLARMPPDAPQHQARERWQWLTARDSSLSTLSE